METIYWKNALEFIKNGQQISQNQIDFKNESIFWNFVQEFNYFGYQVPQNLIEYDDENIDFSDIPEINEETLNKGFYKLVIPISFDKEIALWLRDSKIDYNKIINNFMRTFYESLQSINKNEFANL